MDNEKRRTMVFDEDIFELFKNIECENSLFLFNKNNKFRKFCYQFT
jgi:hypothetical protein